MLEHLSNRTIDDIRHEFRWRIPSQYNLGVDCSDRQPPSNLALIHETVDGSIERLTFAQLSELSNRFANALVAHGLTQGDRLAIVLPQEPITAIAHIATYKVGAIAIPMSTLFGPDALEMRLSDSRARIVVTNVSMLAKVEEISDRLPDLRLVILTEGAPCRLPSVTVDELLAAGAARFEATPTGADDPALLIYTSGTTGGPKGALHSHRVLMGHLPGFELSHDFFPRPGDVFWTPADWAWIGGLMDGLLPTLHHGRCIVSFESPGAYDPDRAVSVMARHKVRNSFLPPTALKMIRQA